jgi:hypothetical protein
MKKYTPERVTELEFQANLSIRAHWNCATSGTGAAYQGLSIGQNVYDAFRTDVVVAITKWLIASSRTDQKYARVPFTELALDMYEASVQCGVDEDVQSLLRIVREDDNYQRNIREAYKYDLAQANGDPTWMSSFYSAWITKDWS